MEVAISIDFVPKASLLRKYQRSIMFNTFFLAYSRVINLSIKISIQSTRSALTLLTLKECFQKMPLPFVGLQAFHWGDGVKVFFLKADNNDDSTDNIIMMKMIRKVILRKILLLKIVFEL